MAEPENHSLHLLQKTNAKLEDHDKRFDKADDERKAMRELLENVQSVVAGIAYFQADTRNKVEELQESMARVERELGLAAAPAE